ncbi:MAG: NADPH-dependent F420 reductase, partial [Halobacteriales archaeon]|nr:NADPH-dependent F420 reductase [Halobacteriales archaeon]
RDPERARTKANEYETELSSRGRDVTVNGFVNEMAADRADVVVLSVPPYYAADTVEAIEDRIGEAILVSPAVGMSRGEAGLHYDPPPSGSVLEHVAGVVPDGVPLVGAFHNLAADRLANLDVELDLDTLIVGDDPDAKETVRMIAEGIEGLRTLDAGPTSNAAEVESLTPLLVTLAMHNEGMHDIGVTFH